MTLDDSKQILLRTSSGCQDKTWAEFSTLKVLAPDSKLVPMTEVTYSHIFLIKPFCKLGTLKVNLCQYLTCSWQPLDSKEKNFLNKVEKTADSGSPSLSDSHSGFKAGDLKREKNFQTQWLQYWKADIKNTIAVVSRYLNLKLKKYTASQWF